MCKKIVIIGGGVISNKIVEMAPEDVVIKCYPIRLIVKSKIENLKILDECFAASVIFYLAYHHRDFIKNIVTINDILSFLKKHHWKGRFIFFNTQATISNKIFQSSLGLIKISNFDLYTITKKTQSRLMGFYSKFLFVSELYLPVVFGAETLIQKRYELISRCSVIHLPNLGENIFASIDINYFVSWIFSDYLDKLNSPPPGSLRRVFVYQNISKYIDEFQKLRDGCVKSASNRKKSCNQIEVKNIKYKYFGSNNLSRGLFVLFKMTPIFAILSIIKYELGKLKNRGVSLDYKFRELGPVPHVFVPVETEFMFFDSSICISKIPFTVIKIEK
jgi:hypothetical protein